MRAVFLDRDGVLNQEVGYVRQLDDLQLMPGAAWGLLALNRAGWFTVLVSNQSGPARGFYGAEHVNALHTRLQKLLLEATGAQLDRISYCPYLSPASGGTALGFARWSTWRKPNTGMLTQAAWRYGIDLQQSYLVGDKATDVDLARNAGLGAILVTSGYGAQVLGGNYQHQVSPDYICADLQAAAQWILGRHPTI